MGIGMTEPVIPQSGQEHFVLRSRWCKFIQICAGHRTFGLEQVIAKIPQPAQLDLTTRTVPSLEEHFLDESECVYFSDWVDWPTQIWVGDGHNQHKEVPALFISDHCCAGFPQSGTGLNLNL